MFSLFSQKKFATVLVLFAALAIGFIPIEAFAQSGNTIGSTSMLDTFVCALINLIKKFAFYVLLGTIILMGIALKMGETREIAIKIIQIIAGVWVVINAPAIADSVSGGQLSRAFNCSLN
jgi:type IV secretory pathway VirB2 component (pilin)